MARGTTRRRRDSCFSDLEQEVLDGFRSAATSASPARPTPWTNASSPSGARTTKLDHFAVHRADIDTFARRLEQLGRARATVPGRLCSVCRFYRYALEEGALEHSPAVRVRRRRLDHESNAVGLDRNEVGGLLVAAGLAGARDPALVSLLALNGLRVSEAVGADIERLGLERRHRTLTVRPKGAATVTMPLAPRTARAVELASSDRGEGTKIIDVDGRRHNRHAADRIVRRTARRAGHHEAGWAAHPPPRLHHRCP
jgi:integrase/recombinase XerD